MEAGTASVARVSPGPAGMHKRHTGRAQTAGRVTHGIDAMEYVCMAGIGETCMVRSAVYPGCCRTRRNRHTRRRSAGWLAAGQRAKGEG